MELHINTEKYSYLKCVFDGKLTAEETLEMIVPDALPDIYEIVDTKAECFLKGKDSENGSITISAVVTGGVIYIPEGETLPKKIEFSVPVTFSAADSNIHSDSSIAATVKVKSSETRILNPRKISIKVSAYSETFCYEKTEVDIPNEIDMEGAKTQFLTKSFSLKTPYDISEKLYVVSDELKLPSNKPPIEDILFSDFTVITDDVKTVGTKAVCNGLIKYSFVYSSSESSEISSASGETQFSQIIEMNSSCDGCIADVKSAVTGIYLNSDLIASANDRCVNFEIHIVSQCVVYNDTSFIAVCDAYSPVYDLNINSGSLKIKSVNEILAVNDTAKVSVSTANISEVISSYAYISSYSEENSSGNIALSCNAVVTVIYADENGNLRLAKEQFKQTTHTSIAYQNLGNVSLCPEVAVSTVLGSGTTEAKISFSYKIESADYSEIPMIKEISYNENEPINIAEYPSIIIRHPCDGDNLWTLSKKYHSSKELILKINNSEGEEDVLSRNFILIPKYK